MAFQFKQNDRSGALRRRPLLPDDGFLDGYLSKIEEDEVPDTFNGGTKKVIVFTVCLPDFPDTQDESLPRMVRIKANSPTGGNVHSKSNLFKVVCALNGGSNPWEKNTSFDIEELLKNGIRVLMENSDYQKKEVEEADGTVHEVDDFQYQWVSRFREAAPGKEKWGKNGWVGGGSKAAPATKKKVSSRAAAKAEESEEETYTPEIGHVVSITEDGEDWEGVVIEVLAKSQKATIDFDGQEGTYEFSDITFVSEGDGEPEEEEEEGEDEAEAVSKAVLNAFTEGIKGKSATVKKKIAAAMKKIGVTKMSDLADRTEAEIVALAEEFKIDLPSEGGDDDLNFLDD